MNEHFENDYTTENDSYVEDDGKVEVYRHDDDGDIEFTIEKLAKEEVYRLRRNLGALDALEMMLMDNIKTMLTTIGRVDNETLMDAINVFNKSVRRSNDIIKGNTAASLIQMLLDSQEETQKQQVVETKQEERQQEQIGLDGRKRVRALLAAIIDGEENSDE